MKSSYPNSCHEGYRARERRTMPAYAPKKGGIWTLGVALLAALLLLLLSTPVVEASCGGTTSVGTTTELNSAISTFNAASTACDFTIELTGDIALDADLTQIENGQADVALTIEGMGYAIDGGGLYITLAISDTVSTLNEITVSHSITSGIHIISSTVELHNAVVSGNLGPGVLNRWGAVTMHNATVTANYADGIRSGSATPSLSAAGALEINAAPVASTVLLSTTVSNNGGDGINNAESGATLHVINSTVSRNSSYGVRNSGAVTVTNSTLADNWDVAFGNQASGTGVVRNSILAGSLSGVDCVQTSGGTLSINYTLVEQPTGFAGGCTTEIGAGTGNLSGQDPLLGPLQNNGGPTETHALLRYQGGASSPAINAGQNSLVVDQFDETFFTDQRGLDRTLEIDVDLGAYEIEGVSDEPPLTCPTFDVTVTTEEELATAILCYNVLTTPGDYTINFGADIALTVSPPTINNPTVGIGLLIDGADYTLDGQDNAGVRPLTIGADNAVAIEDLTVTGGHAIGVGGGIGSLSPLLLTRVTVVENTSAGQNAGGGGIYARGVMSVTESVVSSNTVEALGGYAAVGGGILQDVMYAIAAGAASTGSMPDLQALAIDDSTVNGNIVSGTSVMQLSGGGIAAAFGMSVTDSTVNGNSIIAEDAGYAIGGGISLFGYYTGLSGQQVGAAAMDDMYWPALMVERSSVSDNVITGTALDDAMGGGIFALTAVTLTETTVSGNTIDVVDGDAAWGGGVTQFGIYAGHLGGLTVGAANADLIPWSSMAVIDSTVQGNSVTLSSTVESAISGGGGLAVVGDLTLERSIVAENSVDASHDGESLGGGVAHGLYYFGGVGAADANADDLPYLVIDQSSIVDNVISAYEPLGTDTLDAGGGGLFTLGQMYMVDSTVARNSVELDGDNSAGGGGILGVGVMILSNSTVSENSVSATGTLDTTVTAAGTHNGWGLGGSGIAVPDGQLYMANVTVSHNSFDTYPEQWYGSMAGVAADISEGIIGNSILSNSTRNGSPGPDLYGPCTDLLVQYSLITSYESACPVQAAILDPDEGNIWFEDPHLGPLQDNGGPTLTRALLPGSVAINAGTNGMAVDPWVTPLLWDQRGPNFPRIQGESVDMGAYERAGDVNLRLQKFVKPDGETEVGLPFDFIVFVDNIDDTTAYSVTVTDTLFASAPFTLVSVTDDRGACAVAPDQTGAAGAPLITDCLLDELEPNGRWTIYYNVRADQPADVNNEARVSMVEQVDIWFDDNTDNAAMRVRNPVDPYTGLTIKKTVSVDEPVTGQLHYYTLEITNHEDFPMTNVVVEDDMTGSVDYVFSPDAECVATVSGDEDTTTCTLGDLAPGETVIVRLYVRTKIDVRDGHISDNEVVVTSDTLDGDSQPYTDFDQVFMVFGNVNDVMVRKFGKPDGQAGAGEELTYTILVDNFGPGVAYDVVVTDLMASNGSYSFSAPGCSPAAGDGTGNTNIICERAELAPGEQWQIAVVAQADEAQTINNVADVTAEGTDLDLGNNHAVVEHAVDAIANLAVTKSVDKSSVVAGTDLAYTIRVENLGPSTATNVRILDALPAGVTVKSVDQPANCTLDLTKCVVSTLGAGQEFTLQVVVTVDPSVPSGMLLVNSVQVVANEYDSQMSNNLASVQSTVTADEQLLVEKSASATAVLAGEFLGYEILVANVGTSTVQDVVIRDDLPEEVAFVSYQIGNSDGECVANSLFDPEVVCYLDPLAPGKSVLIRLVTQVDPSAAEGTIRNEVAPDARFTSGSVLAAETEVSVDTSYRLEYTASTGLASPGDIFFYNVKVINTGLSTLFDVMVDVTLPDTLIYVGDTLGCGEALTDCALGDLAPSESRGFQVMVQVVPNATAAGRVTVVSTASASTSSTSGAITLKQTALVQLAPDTNSVYLPMLVRPEIPPPWSIVP